MRHGVTIGIAALGAVLAGCAHNDVLVFGTDTAIALDIQTAATQGASPSLTLGYKRKEGVWLPLVVNGRDSVITPPCTKDPSGKCSPPAGQGWSPEDAKYSSTVTVAKDGATQTTREAYSVFASLGATFNGEANATNGVKSSGGLAQFFATGNAAIQISQNPALVTALKSDSDPAAANAQAQAVMAVAENQSALSITNALSPNDQKARDDLAATAIADHLKRVKLTVSCAAPDASTYRWPAIVVAINTSDANRAGLTAIPRDQLEGVLTKNPALTKAALTAGVAKFSCMGE